MSGASDTKLWIDGASVDALDGATYDDVDPAGGEVFARIARGGAADVDRALVAARRAFDAGPWPRATAGQRAKVLRTLAGLLVEHREELAELESRDAGKPFRETADRDVPRAADNCAFFAGAIEQREQAAFFDRKPFLGREREIVSIVREEPVGVCALLTPWNSPLMQATWKIAPAIAAGNTCVLKPSELTPLSTLRLAELCTQAGVPDGVVNVVTGFGPDAGAPLVADPRVDAVAFTGSEATGIAINTAAAATLKKVTLELGGKSANVVCDDADLELAVEGSVLAMFRHSGQVCLAGTRMYVQSGIYDRFVERYLERVRALRVGDPRSRESDLGPLITPQHRERVERSARRPTTTASKRCYAGRVRTTRRLRAATTSARRSSRRATSRRRSSAKKSSGRFCRSSGSTGSTRSSRARTQRASGSRPTSGRPTWRPPCDSRSGCAPGCAGSTVTSCATCASRSAASG